MGVGVWGSFPYAEPVSALDIHVAVIHDANPNKFD